MADFLISAKYTVIAPDAPIKEVLENLDDSVITRVLEDGGKEWAKENMEYCYGTHEEVINYAKDQLKGEGIMVPDNLIDDQKLDLLRRLQELTLAELETIVKTHNPEDGKFYHLAE